MVSIDGACRSEPTTSFFDNDSDPAVWTATLGAFIVIEQAEVPEGIWCAWLSRDNRCLCAGSVSRIGHRLLEP